VIESIQLEETSKPCELTVTRAELRGLRRARHGLDVVEVDASTVRIGPRRGYVGTVTLPSGRRVVVRPKANVFNLSELLALAFRTTAPPATVGRTVYRDAAPSDWVLLQLATEVQQLLAGGLRRGYVDWREELPFVRGRIRPPIVPSVTALLDCEYSDFIVDTAENRLLRGTLELLAPTVVNRHVRRKLRDALAHFGGVNLFYPSSAAFDRVSVTRLNQHYEPALRLARLAVEGAGVDDADGASTAPAYFVEMWRVWEAAMETALRDAAVRPLHAQSRFSDRFRQVDAGRRLSVTLRPDFLVGPRSAPLLAIDLKWKSPLTRGRSGRLTVVNADIYQMAAYCAAFDCAGLLLYPQVDEPVDARYEFDGRAISVRTVDLGTPGLTDLAATVRWIAETTGTERT
jgi:5-methylcytosine-specific restriction enzyme subunit McrC